MPKPLSNHAVAVVILAIADFLLAALCRTADVGRTDSGTFVAGFALGQAISAFASPLAGNTNKTTGFRSVETFGTQANLDARKRAVIPGVFEFVLRSVAIVVHTVADFGVAGAGDIA